MRNDHEIFTLTLDSHVHTTIKKFHGITWLQTLVIKKVRTTSLYALLNINLFLQQNFLTKTCRIMVPEGRDFDKDSKKYLFSIL